MVSHIKQGLQEQQQQEEQEEEQDEEEEEEQQTVLSEVVSHIKQGLQKEEGEDSACTSISPQGAALLTVNSDNLLALQGDACKEYN